MNKNSSYNLNDSDDFELEKKNVNAKLMNQMYLYSYFNNMFKTPSCMTEKQLIKVLKTEIENLKNNPHLLRSETKKIGSSVDLQLLQRFFTECYDPTTNNISFPKYILFLRNNALNENDFAVLIKNNLNINPPLNPDITKVILESTKDMLEFGSKVYNIINFKIIREDLKKLGFRISTNTLKTYLDIMGFKYDSDDLTEILKEEDLCNELKLKDILIRMGILDASGIKTKPDIEQIEFDNIEIEIGSLYLSPGKLKSCLYELYTIFIKPVDLVLLNPGDKFDYFIHIFSKEVTPTDINWTILQNTKALEQMKIVPDIDKYKQFMNVHIQFKDPRPYDTKAFETNRELIKILKQYGVYINYEYASGTKNDAMYKIEISKSVIDKATDVLNRKITRENERKVEQQNIKDLMYYRLVPNTLFDWTNIKSQKALNCDQIEIKNFFTKLAKAPTFNDLNNLLSILQKSPAKQVKSIGALISCLKQMKIEITYLNNDESTFEVYAKKDAYTQPYDPSLFVGKKSDNPIDVVNDMFSIETSSIEEGFGSVNVDEMFNFDI